MDLHAIGARIKKLRKERGWSRTDLGDAAGLHYNTVRAVEYALASYGVETLHSIAQALGLTVGELVDESRSPPPASPVMEAGLK